MTIREQAGGGTGLDESWPGLVRGVTVGGRYRVEGVLGRGGMGIVLHATHMLTRRPVALKLISPSAPRDPEELQRRFMSEARSASALRHPNVVDVLDMGFHQGMPYLVMELLQGESLEDRLARARRLSVQETLSTLIPVMDAIQLLHEHGIVHRDLKPSNILLSRWGERLVPKLVDFGLARETGEPRMTQAGVVFGTPQYMAPEYVSGKESGPSCDVWAMTVLTFECLCGRSPYTATQLHALLAQVYTGEVLRVRQVCPDVPVSVAEVVDQSLMHDARRRPASMRALAEALIGAARASGISVVLGTTASEGSHPGEARASSYLPVQSAKTERHALGRGAVPWWRARDLRAARAWLGVLLVFCGLMASSWLWFRLSAGSSGRRAVQLVPAPPPPQRPTTEPLPEATPFTGQSVESTGTRRR